MEEYHVIDLIPGYALGILDDPEKEVVEDHLATCGLCRSDFISYQIVVDELPSAIRISRPPDKLKIGIMERIRVDRHPIKEGKPSSIWEKFKHLFSTNTPVWGAVSLAVIILLVFSNVLLWQRMGQLSSDQHELTSFGLQGTDFTPDAVGMLVLSSDGDYGVLIVDGLPNLTEGQQYQLWLIEDGERTSGGVFSVNEDGYGSIVVTSVQPLIKYGAVGITIEPSGGSPGPTGEKVLGAELLY